MPSFINRFLMGSMVLTLSTGLAAQFGPRPPQGHGPKLPAVTAYPNRGTFPTTESVTLMDADQGATIHYTFDGSIPTAQSPTFNPAHLIFLNAIYEGNRGLKTGYTIRAVAIEDGHTNSAVSTFQYTIDQKDRTSYVPRQVLPGVWMIHDSDNDKMFVIHGTKKAILIDSGMGRGPLRQYIAKYTDGLPLTVIFTHNHGDHIGQSDQFIRTSDEIIGATDKAGLVRFLKARGIPQSVIDAHVLTSTNGEKIDIGGRTLELYNAPGHTPGSIVIYDRSRGELFSGDAFGSNTPTVPDADWIMFTQEPLDDYWAAVKNVREEVGPGLRYIVTGHNNVPLVGETYLNNLETCLRRLMDEGNAALIPSYRPVGMHQVVVGDRYTDPNWVAINVNYATYLPAPVEKIDRLVWLRIAGAKLSPLFSPDVKQYTAVVPAGTSSLDVTVQPTTKNATLKIDGVAAATGTHQVKPSGNTLTVDVTSPDGTETATYSVAITRQ